MKKMTVVTVDRHKAVCLQIMINQPINPKRKVVVSHIQSIGCQPENTRSLHGGQSGSWSAEQGKEKKKKKKPSSASPPPTLTYSKNMDQPGKVANPARDQLNRKNKYFPVPVCA